MWCVLSQKLSVEYQKNKNNSSTFAPKECELCIVNWNIHCMTVPYGRIAQSIVGSWNGFTRRTKIKWFYLYIAAKEKISSRKECAYSIIHALRLKWRPTMSWYYSHVHSNKLPKFCYELKIIIFFRPIGVFESHLISTNANNSLHIHTRNELRLFSNNKKTEKIAFAD